MPKCILVVDDDLLVIEFAKQSLKKEGYEVVTAKNGQEALDALKLKIPDLIMLDVQMPQMGGYEFIMETGKDSKLKGIPIIVLTSNEKTGPVFKRHGVKAYLTKPINTALLLEKIRSIVAP